MGREDANLLERGFFFSFYQKLRMKKPDSKLLEMLAPSFNPFQFSFIGD
jgi:hypothetical protein